MFNGFAIVLAWPKTLCKQAGSWYDFPMHYLGISNKGYYNVGHSAVVLVDDTTQSCHYFDFGRYHAPHGYGRVRSAETDHDLRIELKAVYNNIQTDIINLNEVLSNLYENPSTHGTGTIYGAITRIHFEEALTFPKQLQKKEFVRYGPFIPSGTNCSRFVSSTVQAGNPVLFQQIRLKFPLTISPTPMWNLRAIGSKISCVDQPYMKVEKTFINY